MTKTDDIATENIIIILNLIIQIDGCFRKCYVLIPKSIIKSCYNHFVRLKISSKFQILIKSKRLTGLCMFKYGNIIYKEFIEI